VRDDIEDSVRGWLADAYFLYVTSKRDPQVLASLLERLAAFFDNAMMENLRETRDFAAEMRHVPPRIRDSWPAERLPVLEKVMDWAFNRIPDPGAPPA
jgi:hypothetical protein